MASACLLETGLDNAIAMQWDGDAAGLTGRSAAATVGVSFSKARAAMPACIVSYDLQT